MHPKSIQDLADMRLAFVGINIQAHVTQVSYGVAVIAQPQVVALFLHKNLHLVIMWIKKGRGYDHVVRRVLGVESLLQPS